MARGKKKTVIDTAHPHTIKKFELIEEYIKSYFPPVPEKRNEGGPVYRSIIRVIQKEVMQVSSIIKLWAYCSKKGTSIKICRNNLKIPLISWNMFS